MSPTGGGEGMVVWEKKWWSGTHALVLSLVMVQRMLSSCLLAYHLQHEETDWFDKPHQGHGGPEAGPERRQVKWHPQGEST